MRCSIIAVVIFLNLMVFGMGSYFYMIWMQYRRNTPKPQVPNITSYDMQIYLYNRGYLPNVLKKGTQLLSRSKHDLRGNITYVKNSMPRIPSSHTHKVHLDTTFYTCLRNEAQKECQKKTAEFKDKILIQLSNSVQEESNILRQGNSNNSYNVHYAGPREDFNEKPSKQVLCELLSTKLETLKKADIASTEPLRASMPKRGFFENKFFNSCAVVASSGALRGSNMGKFIDSHDVVLRFNNAPTHRFSEDVGAKTTVRLLNSQVVTKKEFAFLNSFIYKNVMLVLWDPSNYSASLEEWLRSPEYDLFPNFIQYRKQEAKPRIYMINPLTIWDVWDFLQRNFPARLRKNPPSSGFVGIRLLLPHCNFVDVVEYVPSSRVTKRCHYYDPEQNEACTFGVWHPLSAEKLLTYHMNEASDDKVFQRGYVRIRGLKSVQC